VAIGFMYPIQRPHRVRTTQSFNDPLEATPAFLNTLLLAKVGRKDSVAVAGLFRRFVPRLAWDWRPANLSEDLHN
jgi:hypothetical protein